MGQTQTVFLPPWIPSTDAEKAREPEFREAVFAISATAGNFVQPHPLHTDPEFIFDWVEHRPFAEAAYRADRRLFKLTPRLVPKRVSEEEFWRNYFSHVFAVKRKYEQPGATTGHSDDSPSAAPNGQPPALQRDLSLATISYPDKYHLAVRYAAEGPPLPNLSDADRILLQALQQQADIGQCNKPRPGMWDTAEEKAKYEAWKKLGNMSPAEAMHLYVQAIEVFNVNWLEWEGLRPPPSKPAAAAANGTSSKSDAAAGPAPLRAALHAMRELRIGIDSVTPAQLALAREECDLLRQALEARSASVSR